MFSCNPADLRGCQKARLCTLNSTFTSVDTITILDYGVRSFNRSTQCATLVPNGSSVMETKSCWEVSRKQKWAARK